jgi:hypothetical protein
MLLDSSEVRVVMPGPVSTSRYKKPVIVSTRFTLLCKSQIVLENLDRLAFSIPSY